VTPSTHGGDITRLLAAVRRGEPQAESQLADLIYDDLHTLALHHMRRERSDHTLQPTALVNEAYVNLMAQKRVELKDRVHLFAAMSRVMRNVLIDYARRRGSAKRPDKGRVELNEFLAAATPRLDDLLVVDEALDRLAVLDARQARVVELIYYGGLTENETAGVLEVSARTVKRDWSAARAWLQAQLRKASG
jgi:RNA polymerase sigma-70 factor (ECF subfamily)